MNRKEAIDLIKDKFPTTVTVRQTDYINGGIKEVVWTPEKRLEQMIDLAQPYYDGLKEGGPGIDESTSEHFANAVEYDYKNANGLW